MRVLLIGSGGFIGRHALSALKAAGHEVRTLRRHEPAGPSLDWHAAHDPTAWTAVLAGMDAAIYLPGTMRDRNGREQGLLERLHHELPAALGRACVRQGVRRLVHVSALCGGDGAYARSKRAGERALQDLAAGGALDLHIVRPSLVIGAGGVSSKQFDLLSLLPWLALPAALHRCRVQPLRIEDLADVLCACLHAPPPATPWPAVGPKTATVAEWIARRRAERGATPAHVAQLPDALVRGSARVGEHLPMSSWGQEALALLDHDSCVDDPEETARLPALLGRPLHDPMEGAWR